MWCWYSFFTLFLFDEVRNITCIVLEPYTLRESFKQLYLVGIVLIIYFYFIFLVLYVFVLGRSNEHFASGLVSQYFNYLLLFKYNCLHFPLPLPPPHPSPPPTLSPSLLWLCPWVLCTYSLMTSPPQRHPPFYFPPSSPWLL